MVTQPSYVVACITWANPNASHLVTFPQRVDTILGVLFRHVLLSPKTPIQGVSVWKRSNAIARRRAHLGVHLAHVRAGP